MIVQSKLRKIHLLRVEIARMKEVLVKHTQQLDEVELGVIKSLQECESVQAGKFTALLEPTAGRCAPKWKDVHLMHMQAVHGAARSTIETLVQADYPAQPGIRLVVGVKP